MPTQSACPSFSEDLGTEIITIHARPENGQKHTFTVHKSILRKKLPLFESKFSVNPASDVVELPDVDPEVLDLLSKWINGVGLEIKLPQRANEFRETTDPLMTSMIKLYGLAQYLESIALMDDALFAMVPIWNRIAVPGLKDIKLAYEVTDPKLLDNVRSGCGLRKYMAYVFARKLVSAKMNKKGMKHQQRLRAAYYVALDLSVGMLGKKNSGEETPEENKSDNGKREEGTSEWSDEVEKDGSNSDRQLFGNLCKLEDFGGKDPEDKTAPVTWSEVESAERMKYFAIEDARWAWGNKPRFMSLDSDCDNDFMDYWELLAEVEGLAPDFYLILHGYRLDPIPVGMELSDGCHCHQHY